MRINLATALLVVVGLAAGGAVVRGQGYGGGQQGAGGGSYGAASYGGGMSGGGMSGGGMSGGGSSGMFGNRSLGGGLSAGQRTFGGSQSGQMGAGNVGQVNSSDRFLRNNRRAGQFVGANAQTARRLVGNAQAGAGASGLAGQRGMNSQGGAGMYGAGGAGMRRFGQGQGQGAQGGRSNTPTMRSEYKVAFDYAALPPSKLSSTVAQRLADTPAIRMHSPIQVEMQGRTAVLRGVVATEHDRVLAEQMARLEAGIEQVQNEIVVGPPEKASSPLPVSPPANSTGSQASEARSKPVDAVPTKARSAGSEPAEQPPLE
jgi:osmotically-inducible protein OsmY